MGALGENWERLERGWVNCALNNSLRIETTDFKPLITFKMQYGDLNDKLQTLFTQEMLKRGYLAAASVYVSAAHTDEIVDKYLENVNEVFYLMSEAIKNNSVERLLQTRVRSDSFSRLTK